MKSKVEKTLYVFLVVLIMITTNSITVASQTGQAVTNLEDGNGVYDTLLNIMSIVAWLGTGIAVFKIMHIGIKYITQPANGRGQAKDALIPWLVGAFVLATFGTLAPWLIGMLEPNDGGGIFNI